MNGDHPARTILNSAILEDYRLWRLKMATVYLPYQPDLWPDLAQEGYIAQWKALDTYDPSLGALPPWLTVAAKLRMKEVVHRGNWTGTLGVKGHTRESPAIPVEIMEHDNITALEHDLDAAMDVRAAVRSLPIHLRRVVFDRFWLDLPLVGDSQHNSEQGRLLATAKPELRARLAHLRPGI